MSKNLKKCPSERSFFYVILDKVIENLFWFQKPEYALVTDSSKKLKEKKNGLFGLENGF
jgi:hypothetical protein